MDHAKGKYDKVRLAVTVSKMFEAGDQPISSALGPMKDPIKKSLRDICVFECDIVMHRATL